MLTEIDSVFYQNAYPVTAVANGLNPFREPDPANLAPLRDGDLKCVAQRVVEHFEDALRGQELTPTRRQKILGWEERVQESGATVDEVAELEKILKRAIVLRDIVGKDIHNSGRYDRGGNGGHRPIELIVHNGHAWSKDLYFPQSREVQFYEGDVWHAIRNATYGEPLAIWLLGGHDRQLSVDQFVLQKSRTYRTQEAHERLQAICTSPSSSKKPSEKTKPQASWPRKRTPGRQPQQPASSRTFRKLMWSTDRRALELDGLRYEGHRQHRYEALLSDILPGYGKPYFERFGHPTHHMTRVAINGALSRDVGTGFAEVLE